MNGRKMKKIYVEKKDLDLLKDWANAFFKEHSSRDLDNGQFVALSYLHAANIFFRKLDTEYVVEYKHIEFQDPHDDRMG